MLTTTIQLITNPIQAAISRG